MIDIKELRVGNWIERVFAPYGNERGSQPEQIKEFANFGSLILPSSYCRPLSISEGLLTKFEFIKDKDGIMFIDAFSTGAGLARFTTEWTAETGIMLRSRYEGYVDGQHRMSHIKYTHQLMNLFYSISATELLLK